MKPGRFETDRWLPFIVRQIERLGVGTVVHGHILDLPVVEHLGTLTIDCEPDSFQPVYFRAETIDAATAELNYFPVGLNEPISCVLHRDCLNEFDLILKCKNASTTNDVQGD